MKAGIVIVHEIATFKKQLHSKPFVHVRLGANYNTLDCWIDLDFHQLFIVLVSRFFCHCVIRCCKFQEVFFRNMKLTHNLGSHTWIDSVYGINNPGRKAVYKLRLGKLWCSLSSQQAAASQKITRSKVNPLLFLLCFTDKVQALSHYDLCLPSSHGNRECIWVREWKQDVQARL